MSRTRLRRGLIDALGCAVETGRAVSGYEHLGMGGCQAIEDAVILADAIGREPSLEAALSRYQATRVPRANSFVERSRRMGKGAHVRAAPVRWLRDAAFGLVPVRLAARALARDLDFRL